MDRASTSARDADWVFVGLGSNVGDRLAHLRAAAEVFARHPAITSIVGSPIYESPAHTLKPGEAQPPYLNAVASIRCGLSPEQLLALCLRIEEERGRVRREGQSWTPRQLDLDVLIFGEDTRAQHGLHIPHPRMGERLFVLRPLADLAPDVRVPRPFNATVRELLDRCSDIHVPVRTAHGLHLPSAL